MPFSNTVPRGDAVEFTRPEAVPADTPERLASMFSAADLPGQFVLSRSNDAVPSGWVIHRLRGWTLGVHPALPVATMRSVDGAEAGWILGHPITEDARFIEGTAQLRFDLHAAPDQMESWLARLSGRFLAIWLTPLFERVYLDAGGLLSAVYAREHDLVASTTSLVPYSRGCDDDLDLMRAARMPYSQAMLSFGMTSRRGVQRLHPNHYLDLMNWSPRRHWPTAPIDYHVYPEDAVEVVSRVIKRHIIAATRRGPLDLALTGGCDSRSLLSCAREQLDQVHLFTLEIPDNRGQLDVELARRIAARHGLSHQVLPYLPPSRSELDAWLWRTGSSISDPRAWPASFTYSSRRDFRIPEMTGVAGEAARVACWRDCGSGKHTLTPHDLVDCLDLPDSPGILASAHAWMKSYPASSPVELLDGFYIEQEVGGRTGALAYGDAPYVQHRLYPFLNREALDAMSRLPEAYKLSRRFPVDLIRHNWPELLRTPFNNRPGLRRYVDKVRRHAWLARAALAGSLAAR